MALGDGTAILTAIRERVIDSTGTLRATPADRFKGGIHAATARDRSALRSLSQAAVEVEPLSRSDHPDTPQLLGSYALRDMRFRITVVRGATMRRRVKDAFRVALQGQAIDDEEAITQALETPNQLVQTQAGDPTGLVSGLLRRDGATSFAFEVGGGDAQTYARMTLRMTFRGVVRVELATS